MALLTFPLFYGPKIGRQAGRCICGRIRCAVIYNRAGLLADGVANTTRNATAAEDRTGNAEGGPDYPFRSLIESLECRTCWMALVN